MINNYLFLNWQALITPKKAAWTEFARRPNATIAASIFWHWLLGLIGWFISFNAAIDLLVAAGLTAKQVKLSVGLGVAFAIISLILLVSTFLLLGLFISGAFALIGVRTGYRNILAVVCVAGFPITVGLLLGKLSFALVEPLTAYPPLALSLLLKPYSMGTHLLFTSTTIPLSMQWFITRYLDVFWLWSLVIFSIVTKQRMDLGRLRLGFLISVIVLLSLLLITLQWQLAQQVLAGMI